MCMVIEKLARQSRGGKEFTIPFHIFKNIYIVLKDGPGSD